MAAVHAYTAMTMHKSVADVYTAVTIHTRAEAAAHVRRAAAPRRAAAAHEQDDP